MEIWMPIPGYGDNYEASSEGRIKSKERVVSKWHHSGKTITQTYKERILSNKVITRDGYIRVGLGFDGNKISIGAHRLVLLAFAGEPNESQQALHINGIPSDNRIINLRWGTALENAADRATHGKFPIGQDHPKAILTDDEVRLIRNSTGNGAELARRYGVTRTTISYIRKGKTWRHL